MPPREAEPSRRPGKRREKTLSRSRRWVKRLSYGAVLTVMPMVLIAAISVLVIQVRLQHGPISLKVFVPPIERGISAGLGDFSAEIGDLEVSLSPEGRLEFQLTSVVIKDADGTAVASAPRAEVALSKPALWALKIVPERVLFVEPEISLFYSREGGLSLSFNQAAGTGESESMPAPGAAPPTAPPRHAPLQGQVGMAAETPSVSLQRIDLARLLALSSARARRGDDASSYLREFGFRNARVRLDHDGKISNWTVEEAGLDLEHMKRRSVISGNARIASSAGPWSLTFRTEDSEATHKVSVKASVRDFVPRAASQSLSNPGLLSILDLPVAADAGLELSTSGVLDTATLAVEFGRGAVRTTGADGISFPVDSGLLHFEFDAAAKHAVLAPSTIKWGESAMTFEGEAQGPQNPDVPNEWSWSGKVIDGSLVTGEFGIDGLAIENGTARGSFNPDQGSVTVADVQIKAGEAQVAFSGQLVNAGSSPSLLVNGASAPMPVTALKALWPRFAVPAARAWFGNSITKGTIGAARLKIATGVYQTMADTGGELVTDADRGLSLAFEATGLEAAPPDLDMTFDVPRALVRVAGTGAEVTVPDAAVIAPSGKRIPLKGTRFVATGLGGEQPLGELSLRSQTSLQPVAEIALKRAGVTLDKAQPFLQSLDGKADVTLTATAPLLEGAVEHEIRLNGKAKISDIKAKQKLAAFELQGGTIDADIKDGMVTATGEVLVNGVLAKLAGTRNLAPEAENQAPLTISARLDNADRAQLGIDVNHIVQGEVPVDVTVAFDDPASPKIMVHGNLADAEISLRDLAWKKPRGRAGTVDFEVKKNDAGVLELQNFKVIAENMGVEGWLSLDADNEVREFYFPEFSMNVVSRLEVQGKLSPARIWSIKARGPTFDGRDFFRNLVSLGNSDENRIRPMRPCAGMDIDAEIGTIIGHNDVSVRDFKVRMSERNEKMVALDAEGTMDGGNPLSVVLKRDQDQSRIVSAVTSDAGQASRLIGFYRSIERGRSQVEINLDGKGAAERSGNVWIEDFVILGDPVVSEVVANTPDHPSEGPSPKGKQKVVRERIDFNRLFARFSAGHGQLVIEDAAVKGPLLGATITGKIDYGTQRMSLGGTYIPLQGINAAFCNIPVVGQIISGTGCEGLLGITYAIQGPLPSPQVIVNPFSIVAPGIFREIFQMTNPNPQIQPRGPQTGSGMGAGSVGTSSSPVTRNDERARPAPVPADSGVDGWSMGSDSRHN